MVHCHSIVSAVYPPCLSLINVSSVYKTKEGRWRKEKENQFSVTFSENFNFMMPRPGQDPRNKHVTASLQ